MEAQGARQIAGAGGVDLGDELVEGKFFARGQGFQLGPEFWFQGNTGAVVGDADGAFHGLAKRMDHFFGFDDAVEVFGFEEA